MTVKKHSFGAFLIIITPDIGHRKENKKKVVEKFGG